MHEFWHTETTFWLRELDVGYERLPDYYGGERRPDLSGQRQPTWPPFRPPEEGVGVMLRRKYEPGEDPPDVDSHINALLEQARREQVHRQTANLSRVAVKRTTVVLTFRENIRLSVQQKCHLSIPGWCQMVGLPELPGIAASAGFLLLFTGLN